MNGRPNNRPNLLDKEDVFIYSWLVYLSPFLAFLAYIYYIAIRDHIKKHMQKDQLRKPINPTSSQSRSSGYPTRQISQSRINPSIGSSSNNAVKASVKKDAPSAPTSQENKKSQRRKPRKVVLADSLTQNAPRDTTQSELQTAISNTPKKTKKKTKKKQQLETQDYFATQTTSADATHSIPDTTYVVAFDAPANQATGISEPQSPSDKQTTSTVTSTLSEITKDPSEGRSKSYINKQGEEIKLPLNKKGEVTYKIKKSGIGKLSIHPDLLDTLDFIQIKKLNDLCDRSNVLEECENTKGKNCIFKINQENKTNEKSKDKGDNEQYKLFLKIWKEDYRFFATRKEPNKSKDPNKRKSKNFENYIVTGYLPSHKKKEKIISFPKKQNNESDNLEGNRLELNLNKSIKK